VARSGAGDPGALKVGHLAAWKQFTRTIDESAALQAELEKAVAYVFGVLRNGLGLPATTA
jgi:hypothetical protein